MTGCLALGCMLVCLGLSACSQQDASASLEKRVQKTEMPVSVADQSAMISNEPPIAAKPVVQVFDSTGNSEKHTSKELVLADFNSGSKPNNLGGDFGVWNKDPDDISQGCRMDFEEEDALPGAEGKSLRLDYDVESENPAYNGFWMKLNGLDASDYNTVSLYIRGEGLKNFTKRVKFEIKDSANRLAPYIVSGITEKWQKIEIPFERFRKIQDWSSMGEFVIVFDDMNSDPKEGTILIDRIAFIVK